MTTRRKATRAARWTCGLVALMFAATLATDDAAGFGGEDPVAGGPWYHEQLTLLAAESVGFSTPAGEEVAWHADYIDSYLYNPLFWAQGGLDRLKVSIATTEELAKLHFDDNTETRDVVAAWRRYLSGTLAGLLWAADNNDVAAARNILGVSLHAIQDLHAHSNWVDDTDRRGRTLFDSPRAERDAMWLFTGTYELPDHLGLPVHGKFAPQCLALTNGFVSALLELGCIPISPLSNSTVCHAYKSCDQNGTSGSPLTIFGIEVPAGVAYYDPPGIALDSRWMADIAVVERGLDDINGSDLFDRAYAMALRASKQWLHAVDVELRRAGHITFWDSVRAPQTHERELEFEDFSRLPYQFLSAGPYPDEILDTQWFLRVSLETASDNGSGTDADIYLSADGADFLLDYAADTSPLFAHNDFERSSHAVYTVGPFDNMPSSITLTNDAANTGEVVEAAVLDFADAFVDAVWALGDFLLSIVGGEADLVATNTMLFTPEDLAGVPTTGQSFSIRLDGGGEGDYRLHGSIARIAQSTTQRTYEVELQWMYCIDESDWDRWTDSDEPFFMLVLTPAPGDVQPLLSGPFVDVDAGEWREMFVKFQATVPTGSGSIGLGVRAMESDGETPYHRSQLLSEFAGAIDSATEAERQSVVEAIAAAAASDWKLRHIKVHAFTRGDEIRSATVLDVTVNDWFAADTSRSYTLGPVPPIRIHNMVAVDQSTVVPAAVLFVDP